MGTMITTLRIERKCVKTHQQLNHERVIAMKALLLGMMICMAAGAEALILIPDGPLTLQQQVFFGLICGTIGTVVGLAMWDIPSADPTGKHINPMKAMARQGAANLGLATLLATTFAYAFNALTGIPITIPVLAPISGILGIGGSAWFAKIWPYFLEQSAKRTKRHIDRTLDGILNKDDDTN